MPRTISDEEYNHLVGRKTVADFVEPIYNSKELGAEARALIKKAYPNLQIEGFDLKQELKSEIDLVRNEFRETERQRKDREETEKFQQVRKKTQDEFKFTEEGMRKLEDLMVERNIGDYRAGALLMASEQPRAVESHIGPAQHYWNHEKQDGFAEISKDPEKWGMGELLKAAERDSQRARSQGF